jgi:hypothetical protein
MKYLTTLEVARELGLSKQTVLNWLYAGKIPEPPRNKKGYRLWSPSRLSLVRRLIAEGRLHKRTIVHRVPANRPDVVADFAREVVQFLQDAQVDPPAFLRELVRCDAALEPFVRLRKAPAKRPSPPQRSPASSPRVPTNPAPRAPGPRPPVVTRASVARPAGGKSPPPQKD